MNFIRLGGCSIGCDGCDTDYRVTDRMTAKEIGHQVASLPRCEWSFVTGGEPADHDLWPLLETLRLFGRVAVVTSGSKGITAPMGLIDFLTVSPHETPAKLAIRRGNQVNLVPGLNGLDLKDWADYPFAFDEFQHKWITPLYGSAESLASCREWISTRSGWRLGVQAHKAWGVA